MVPKLLSFYKAHGTSGVLTAVKRRLLRQKSVVFPRVKEKVSGKKGLEIGGPTSLFARHNFLPVYPIAAQIDNANFASDTIWEGSIESGETFQFDKHKAAGKQFVLEATDLKGIAAETYDFVLASHVIEHTANPLKALAEWMRVLTAEGALLLVVPHKAGTFDHRRKTTTLRHLIADFEQNRGEDDLTHLAEILEHHDLSKDPEAGSFAQFKSRSARNFENRCLHHHVFDTQLVLKMLDYVGLQILAVDVVRPYHIIVLSEKSGEEATADNTTFLGEDAAYRRRSPFQIDKS